MITDRRHAYLIRQHLNQAVEELVAAWIIEHENANAPASGPAVTVSGGGSSDPVFQIATDPTRTQHADRLGRRIAGLLDAAHIILEDWRPKNAEAIPPCRNCGEMPGIMQGRCPECGPFFRKHGTDRDPEKVADKWAAALDTRPCRQCGIPLKVSEGKRTCDSCRQEKSRARRQAV